MPGPLIVELAMVRANAVVDRLFAKLAVVLVSVSAPSVNPVLKAAGLTPFNVTAPPPFSVAPVCCANAPLLIVHVWPAATETVPVFVKLGVVPLWFTVRSALALIVPALRTVFLTRLRLQSKRSVGESSFFGH